MYIDTSVGVCDAYTYIRAVLMSRFMNFVSKRITLDISEGDTRVIHEV